MGAALDVRGASKSYDGYAVFTEVDLGADAGELVAVTGPNGAGKTTLISCIAAREALDQGEILWQGTIVDDRTPQIREAIASAIGEFGDRHPSSLSSGPVQLVFPSLTLPWSDRRCSRRFPGVSTHTDRSEGRSARRP